MEQRLRARPERRTAQQRDAQLDRIEDKLDEALALLQKLTGGYTARAGGVGQGIADRTYKVVIDEADEFIDFMSWTGGPVETGEGQCNQSK